MMILGLQRGEGALFLRNLNSFNRPTLSFRLIKFGFPPGSRRNLNRRTFTQVRALFYPLRVYTKRVVKILAATFRSFRDRTASLFHTMRIMLAGQWIEAFQNLLSLGLLLFPAFLIRL
ncbi:hypothetical protein IE53DRAFT_383926 [Violaceomyces palustris]|uniref:Uncharacterized protein n=1 Tax=Violaceomyces palustris TaxID=1673888 RepID=A0ACD0P642_9BASI|nr:hypothetical protein IE53DRAFT_383926 [Violaceomyces palustris]